MYTALRPKPPLLSSFMYRSGISRFVTLHNRRAPSQMTVCEIIFISVIIICTVSFISVIMICAAFFISVIMICTEFFISVIMICTAFFISLIMSSCFTTVYMHVCVCKKKKHTHIYIHIISSTICDRYMDLAAGVLILWYGGWLAIEQDGRMTAGMLITYQVLVHVLVCVLTCVYVW